MADSGVGQINVKVEQKMLDVLGGWASRRAISLADAVRIGWFLFASLSADERIEAIGRFRLWQARGCKLDELAQD